MVVADIKAEWVHKIADRIGGVSVGCDVADPERVAVLLPAAQEATTPGSAGPAALCGRMR